MITEFSLPTDTTIAYSRHFDAPVQQVWDAYTKPELVTQWLGYGEFTRCDMDIRPGGSYDWEWQLPDFTLRIRADVLEVEAPTRMVVREYMSDMDFPPTLNTVEFLVDGDRTLMRGLIEYESREARDAAYATGMARGMDDSFAALGKLLAA